jgi:hypothetical protein
VGLINLIIAKIAVNNLTDLLFAHSLSEPFIADLYSSLYRETYLIYTLKHCLPLVNITLTQSDILAIERSIINSKHPSKAIADHLLTLP